MDRKGSSALPALSGGSKGIVPSQSSESDSKSKKPGIFDRVLGRSTKEKQPGFESTSPRSAPLTPRAGELSSGSSQTNMDRPTTASALAGISAKRLDAVPGKAVPLKSTASSGTISAARQGSADSSSDYYKGVSPRQLVVGC
jgi:hypothetical protein